MSRILIATVPIKGHVNPMLPLARELVQRGHEVRWYSGSRYAVDIEKSGAATHVPFKSARDWDDSNIDVEFPERSAMEGVEQLKYDIKHIFIDAVPGQLADLDETFKEFAPAALVADPAMFGALLLHEKWRVPFAVVGVVPYSARSRDTAPFGMGLGPGCRFIGRARNCALNWVTEHLLFRDVQQHWARVRSDLGFATTRFILDAGRQPTMFLQPTVPAFEYPRSDLSPNVRFIGALPPPAVPCHERPGWLDEIAGSRPVVLVSQGTIANAKPDLFMPTVDALADEDVLVVITTGGRSRESLGLTEVPPNFRVAPFLTFTEILPHISVMVTNGGYGSVQLALSHGVPLIVAGATEDKPEVAARVAWSGCGLNLRTARPTAKDLRAAVREVLLNTQYGANALRLARQYARYDSISLGAKYVESILQ